MSTALLWRLVWKDTRILLPVWLAVFGMAVAMQLLSAILGAINGDFDYDMGIMLTVALMSFFPLPVAAGAIQFAGESEEGTDEWLRQLPIPAWWLASVKLLTPIVAFVLYFVAATLTGLLISRFQWSSIPTRESFVAAAAFFLILFATSVLFSQLTKKVVAAAAFGLLCALTVQLALPAVVYSLKPSESDVLYFQAVAIIGIGLLGIDFFLAVRWVQGKSILPAVRAWLTSNSGTRPSLWEPSLRACALRRDPLIRQASVLAWKELRSITVFLILWGLAGWAIVHGSFITLPELDGVSILYMLSTPLVAGLMAYMRDQSREMQLFFGHRGVSPALVWITRNSLWFSAAMVLVLGWSLWDRYGLHPNEVPKPNDGANVHPSLFQIVDEIRVHYPMRRPYGPATAEDVSLQVSFVGSLLLGCFALGGMCGMWYRRPVIAATAAVVGGVLLYLWHRLILVAAVPLWLTIWPLAILWLVATWRGCDRWLASRTNWVRQGSWMFAPCALVVAIFPFTRLYQIPAVGVSLDEIEVSWMDYDPQQAEAWNELQQILQKESRLTWHEDPKATRAFTDQIHVIANMDPPGLWSLTAEQRYLSRDVRGYMMVFAQMRGMWLHSESRLREELSLYIDCLRLLDRMTPVSTSDVRDIRSDQVQLLRLIIDAVNHPDCDVELLQSTLEELYTNSDSWYSQNYQEFEESDPLLATAIKGEVVMARQLVRGSGPYFELFTEGARLNRSPSLPKTDQAPPGWLLTLYSLSGEHARYERLLAAVVAEMEPDSPINRDDILRWFSVSPPLTSYGAEFNPSSTFRVYAWLGDTDYVRRKELLTAARMTVLAVALQLHREVQGKFPDQLAELQHDGWYRFHAINQDPYSQPSSALHGDEFDWFPEGLVGPLFIQDRMVPPRQPLLLSHGLQRLPIQFRLFARNSSQGAYVDGTPGAFQEIDRFLSTQEDVADPSSVPDELPIDAGPPEEIAVVILGGSALDYRIPYELSTWLSNEVEPVE